VQITINDTLVATINGPGSGVCVMPELALENVTMKFESISAEEMPLGGAELQFEMSVTWTKSEREVTWSDWTALRGDNSAGGGNDGLPLLSIIWSTTGVPEFGYLDISQNNGLLSRAVFPDAWAKIQEAIATGLPSVITEEAWQIETATNGGVCGKFSTGDGSTTFRVPLIAKRFVRATGADLPVGTVQGDAIRNITGSLPVNQHASTDAQFTGAFGGVVGDPGSFNGGSNNISRNRVYFDTSRVVPTADENRPVAVAYTPMLKMYGSVTEASEANIAALVQGLALKLDTSRYEAETLGIGQKMVNVASQRALNTTYTNTDSKPRMIHVVGTQPGTAQLVQISITVNDFVYVNSTYSSSQPIGLTVIVFPGDTYSATIVGSASLHRWGETVLI
jgi:hypothetical protein